MDYTALAFYAVICGGLSSIAPSLGTPFIRFGTGAIVGVAAAMLLPVLKSAVMGY